MVAVQAANQHRNVNELLCLAAVCQSADTTSSIGHSVTSSNGACKTRVVSHVWRMLRLIPHIENQRGDVNVEVQQQVGIYFQVEESTEGGPAKTTHQQRIGAPNRL